MHRTGQAEGSGSEWPTPLGIKVAKKKKKNKYQEKYKKKRNDK